MVSLYKLKGAEEYERRLKMWKQKFALNQKNQY